MTKKKHPVLKFILITFLVIIALLGLLVFMLYNDISAPAEDYEGAQLTEDSFKEMISDDIDTFLSDITTESKLNVGVTSKEANQLIKAIVLDKLGENTRDEDYAYKTDYFGLNGVFMQFSENKMVMNVSVHVFIGSITFKTSATLEFEITDNKDEITLNMTGLSIGKLPLLWASGIADSIFSSVTGESLDDIINSEIESFGKFSLNDKSMKIDIEKLISSTFEDDPKSADLVNTLLDFIYQNELFSLTVDESQFSLSLALGKMYDNSTEIYTLPEDLRITSESDIEKIFTAKTSSLILSTLNPYAESPRLDLDSVTINRLFDYYYRSNNESDDLVAYEFENITIEATLPYVSLNDSLYLNLPIYVYDKNTPDKRFVTVLKIKTSISVSGEDLLFEIMEINAGDILIKKDQATSILSLVMTDNLFEDGKIVIKDFDTLIGQNGITFDNVSVAGNILRVETSFMEGSDFDTIHQGVQDALNDLQNTYDGTPVGDAIDTLLSSMGEGDDAINNNVNGLVDAINGMDDDEQAQFKQEFEDKLKDLGIDLSELYSKN